MRRLTILLAALGALLLVSAAPASASELKLKEAFGSAQQPLLAQPVGMAVDQSSGDLYVIDFGGNEKQRLTFTGFVEGDTFRLENLPGSCTSSSTAPITYKTSVATLRTNIVNGLGAVCGGSANFAATSAVIVEFKGTFAGSTQPLMGCVKETGSGTCATTRTQGAHAAGLYRYKSNGEADNFSAGPGAGTNRIGSPALTFPTSAGLSANKVQVAVDNSGTATNGDVYVAQGETRPVKVFSSTGAELGSLSESSEGAFTEACGVAVDSAGKLYVGDFGGKVHKYSPTSNGPPFEATNTNNFAAEKDCNLAAGAGPTAGSIFVAEGSPANKVAKLDSSIGALAYSVGTTATNALSVDPATGHLYRSAPGAFAEYDASGATEATLVSETALPLTSTALGFAVNGASGNVYVNRSESPTVTVYTHAYPLTVSKTGEGSGTVTSSPSGINCGSECSASYEAGTEVTLTPTAEAGSKFTGWSGACSGTGTCKVTMSEAKSVTASFGLKPAGPTNRRTLTITKSAGGTGGVGTVTSKPKGIKCATACSSAVASFYENATIVLKAKAANGSSFASWTGCEAETVGATEGTCTVAMSADKAVTATFGPTSKAIASPTALTVSKGESTGTGAVKGTGLGCEAECTATTVLYQGPVTEPKPKEAKTVVLSQAPAYGSEFSGWSGCDSVAEGKCTVAMTEAKEVTAEYTAKPIVALTIEKAGTGTGTVTSKPKGLKCATTCTTQAMAVPSGEAVVLKAKAASGMTFTGWSGGGCSGNAETCTVNPSSATKVTATFTGSPKPILSPTALTLTKAGSGFGTIKASGLACEAACSTATSIYQGTITEPKPKEAKTVILEALSAPGSKTVVWSGCDSEEAGKCVVTMSAAKEVTATFDELE